MINRLYIDNFKSLVEFELPLSQFTCLIGLNGAGKSTVLQALDFASAVMSGEVSSWLAKRQWASKDINSKLVKRNNIEIEIDLSIIDRKFRWKASFNRSKNRCTSEQILDLDNEQTLFSYKNGHYILPDGRSGLITNEFQGSVLAGLMASLQTDEMKVVKGQICAIRSLDLLSPQSLRKKARNAERENIGIGGEQLSAFLHQLRPTTKKLLLEQLQQYYPQIESIQTGTLQSGWVQLKIKEQFAGDQKKPVFLESEARHINDGLLRLMAIYAQQLSPLETLLFDEIENGINSEITEKIVDALVASPKQIIVTTQSPMVLNYLEDEVAKKSVVLIYKRQDGMSRSISFFNIPSVLRKLNSLAPGEAMLDVYLEDVIEEARELLISPSKGVEC